MPSFTLQRATWSLQISRTSRSFAVSFTTSIPRRRLRHTATQLPSNTSTSHTPLPSSLYNISQRSARHNQARTAFTSTKVYREQQTQQAQQAVAPQASNSKPPDTSNLSEGFSDEPIILDEGTRQVDWARSFHGLSTEAFSPEAATALLAPIDPNDIEIKPDGIIYLPEIKYRRILNKAFGPGAWGLAPRGETIVTPKAVTREYALVALGRLVSVARGEQDYFSQDGIPTAAEGCKSNAMMRCCKDLGVASELWDPRFIQKFLKEKAKEIFVEHQVTKKRKKIWLRKDDMVKYPFKETKYGA